MLPRLFSLPLAHASLHGQLLRPAAACNLLVIAKPHRIAINDPLAHYFVQAGYAVLATELLTEPSPSLTTSQTVPVPYSFVAGATFIVRFVPVSSGNVT